MWRWLLHRVRPPQGWMIFVMLLATVACLPLAVTEAGWLSGSEALLGAALLGAWLGYICGHVPVPGWMMALFGLLTGIEWNVITAGRLWPSWEAIARELSRSLAWLGAGMHGRWTWDLPLVPLAYPVWVRLQVILVRFAAWAQAGVEGQASSDSLVLLILAGAVAWWLCYYAGWQLARRRSALWALWPVGTAILTNVAFTYGRGVNYLRAYMGGALVLVALAHFDHLQRLWERDHIDYSPELRRSAQVASVTLSAALVVLALLVPYITWQQTIDLFWRHAYEPWSQVSQRFDRLFGGRNPVPAPEAPARYASEAQQLSSPVTLGRAVVLLVRTSDPPPLLPEEVWMHGFFHEPMDNPKHYWRTLTYDTYTGRGWKNDSVQETERQPNEPLAEIPSPYKELTQTFEILLPGEGFAPAASEPVQVDRAVTIVERQAGDMVGLSMGYREYTIVSHIPTPTIVQLREAGTEYPPETAARYLALPPIPARVRALAEDVTAEAETPYDKALAIERYLRGFEYTLETPTLPAGACAADFLLFDAQRGHCEYFATAMVVMLRALGVPARYAVGYAMGQYDPARHLFIVTERDGHAWPEVYFPGIGWIEFEPTPSQPMFARPAGGPVPTLPPFRPRQPVTPPRPRTWWNILAVLTVGALAVGGASLWAFRLLRTRPGVKPERMAREVYARMLRWAEWLRLGPAPGDTPIEFSQRLGQAIEKRGPWAYGATEEARLIGQAYVQARYALQPPTPREAGRAQTAWQRLWPKLRRMFFWRW